MKPFSNQEILHRSKSVLEKENSIAFLGNSRRRYPYPFSRTGPKGPRVGDPPTFVHVDNRISSSLAIVAGVLLAIAHPPLVQTTNAWTNLFVELSRGGLTVFAVLAFIMSVLVQFVGITICLGGVLSFKSHLRSGKELIGLATGVGLADLLLLAQGGSFGPSEWVGWTGLVLAVLAGRHLHGPEASYAGEVRKLLGALRARLVRKNVKKRVRKRHSRSLRARRVRPSTVEYDVGSNKKGEA